MLFSSITFLFYFLPAVLVLYYLTCWSRTIQNMILLVMSLLFYAWGEPGYVFLMVGSILFNYVQGLLIDRLKEKRILRKWILIFTITGNVGVLFIFKYLSFVIQNINEGYYGGFQLTVPTIIIPIGISFFTFQAISYIIDVYRDSVEVQKNPFYLGLYISFFPQLVAGPIVRYETIQDQIVNRKESWSKFSVGSCRFITGLAKKMLLSNTIAVIADRVFTMQQEGPIAVTLAWLGAIAYTFQIYYDFSGYSDMAIGLGLMFGFKFDENFNYPYISQSISEFWRRWHISLGTWFKDYVYIPLGGSRVRNKDQMVRNLFIVWLLTGIWHGAEWTFFFWGMFNFGAIIVEKLLSFEELRIRPIWKHMYCMLLVILGWVLFRSENLLQAGAYFKTMFGFGGGGFFSATAYMFLKENLVFLVLGILFAMPVARKTNRYVSEQKTGWVVFEFAYPVALTAVFFICICYMVKGTYNPFIYFNF